MQKLFFTVPREDDHTINNIRQHITEQKTSKVDKVTAMIKFVTQNKQCRSVFLLYYFGEKEVYDCGICDICKSKNSIKDQSASIKREIMDTLQNTSLSSRELLLNSQFEEDDFLEALRELVEFGTIKINARNKYELA